MSDFLFWVVVLPFPALLVLILLRAAVHTGVLPERLFTATLVVVSLWWNVVWLVGSLLVSFTVISFLMCGVFGVACWWS